MSHAFGRIGTFVGRLRVRYGAGNVSYVRSFTVTVIPRAGETIDGSGSVAGVRGSAAFALSQISVSARYVHSRLSGSIPLQGIASRPGPLVASIRRTPRGTALLRPSAGPSERGRSPAACGSRPPSCRASTAWTSRGRAAPWPAR